MLQLNQNVIPLALKSYLLTRLYFIIYTVFVKLYDSLLLELMVALKL